MAFIIYALPRSRTYWLSKFLTYGAWKCGHDELQHVRGLDDVKSLLSMPHFGSVETAAAPFWRLVQTMQPDIKTVVIRRSPEEVLNSLFVLGVAFDEPILRRAMYRLDAKLDQIERRIPGVLSVNFAHLAQQSTCAQIYEHCTGNAMNQDWYSLLKDLRLTIDFEDMLRRYQAHQPQLERVGRLAKQRMLAKIARRPVVSETMTFKQETLDDFIPDAQKLFAQHSIEVGEPPDSWQTKNIELMYALERLGVLYITTARCNGRMFGYLMSLIAPALDSRTGVDGIQTLFYVSSGAPGLSLKLQRASVEFLRRKGVHQVAFRAGPRASGDKISAIFRRMGAQDAGHMFTLDLKEAV